MSDSANKQVFANNLAHYMDTRGKGRKQICSDLGIQYATLAAWENAKTYPRAEKIEQLAGYFGVEQSDLTQSGSGVKENDMLRELERLFFSLHKEERYLAMDYLRYLSSRRK